MQGIHQSEPEKLRSMYLCSFCAFCAALEKSVSQTGVPFKKKNSERRGRNFMEIDFLKSNDKTQGKSIRKCRLTSSCCRLLLKQVFKRSLVILLTDGSKF